MAIERKLDRVRVRILGVTVETVVLESRPLPRNRLQYRVRVPADIQNRADIPKDSREWDQAERMKRDGLWCFKTGLEFLDADG